MKPRIQLSAVLLMLSAATLSAQDISSIKVATDHAAITVQDAVADAAAAFQAAPEVSQSVNPSKWWTESCAFNIGLNQNAFVNWAAGGYHSVSLAASIDGKANYAKDKIIWNNRIQLDYGFLWSADKRGLMQKSTDRMYLESTWSYKMSDKSKWDYTASYDLKSQFSNTFDNYVQDPETGKWSGTLKSGFMSPGYTNLALGISWIPTSWFNMNLAPITGGVTICAIEDLRKSYGMPVKYVETQDDGTEITHYHSRLFQFGTQLKANFKATINDVFVYETQLVMFYDYINRPKVWECAYDETGARIDNVQVETAFPIRINWDNKISWSISKFISLAFNTWLIYDPNVTIYENGEPQGDKIQFKEFLAISFTYSIRNK